MKHKLRILLAEDNPVNQKVALRQLEKMGYTADVAANGLEVLSALRQMPYDVVLMDCQMPEMDGYEATRRIRSGHLGDEVTETRFATADPKHVRIIAMTANAMQGDREKCLAAGMDDYISKPLRREDLQSMLERYTPPGKMLAEVPPGLILNQEVIEGLRSLRNADGSNPLVEVIDLFFEHTPESIKQLKEAVQSRHVEHFARTAHALKGSCAIIGAERLSAMFESLEAASSVGLEQVTPEVLAGIDSEYLQAKAALEIERNR